MSRNVTDLHPVLQDKVSQLRTLCHEKGIEIGISECLRTVAEQDALYAKGRTTAGSIVTSCKGSSFSSMHQWGVAFDFYLKVDVDGDGLIADDAFNNNTHLFNEVGKIGQSIGLEWGGSWTSHKDLPHFQLPNWGSTASKLKAEYSKPEHFIATWNVLTSANETIKENSDVVYSHKYLIAMLQDALNKDLKAGLKVDGYQGPKTFAACPTLNYTMRKKYPNVTAAYEQLMKAAGYYDRAIDGDFYKMLKIATMGYQAEIIKMKKPDGEATRMKKTWSSFLRLS